MKDAGWRLTLCVSSVIILACILSVGWFYSFQQDKLFAERQEFFTQFAEKTAENIELSFEDYWNHSLVCQEFILLLNPTDEGELVSSLSYCAESITSEQAIILAFTEEGEFYSSDGHEGWLGQEYPISFSASAPARQTAIVNLPYENTETSYFLLFSRMEQPIHIAGGDTITHFALAINVQSLQELFASKSFGNSSHTYLVTNTGRRLYQNTDSQRFIDGYNVLTAIEHSAEVIGGGTMEDLLASFTEEGSTAYEIKYKDEKWFVSFAQIGDSEHFLIIFAPTDLVGNNAATLTQVSLLFLLFICVLLVLLFAVLLRSVWLMLKQLREVNDLLESDAKAADAASRAKSEFLSNMSHDIRTPINGIMGMTSIAMKNKDDHDKVMSCLAKIDEASGHLLSLVNDVLDMSRIERGKTAAAHESVNLRTLLENCTSIIEGQLAMRNLDFTCDFGELPYPHVISDELHLRQILINILGNAVKFTQDGGHVGFRVRQEAAGPGRAKIVFEVEDTGIGMEPSYLEHIWEPFSQSKQGQRGAYEGTGLGMAITKRFVDMLGGQISVKSELGKGSVFTVCLEVDIDTRSSEEKKIEDEAANLEGLKVLLVEDKEINREIAREILQDAGAIVCCAENGRQALDMFVGEPAGTFDVILMDVMMPVMDGIEATRAIRASEHAQAKTVPIVALTAYAFDEDVQRTLEAGMNAHLSKPVEVRALTQALSQYHLSRYMPSAQRGTTSENASCESATLKGASLEGTNILLAEDDLINMEVSQAILEECGAFVVPVENGQEAVDAFAERPEGFFDMILMDLHMPILGGIEATQAIRALDRADARRIPIFALTADFGPEDESEMTSAGIDAPLLKPLNTRLLIEAYANATTKE